MSDKEATGAYDANEGITRPDYPAATHNGGLSPLFFSRSGTVRPLPESDVLHRGYYGRWYSPGAIWDTFAYYFALYTGATWPSSKDSRREAYSLRCLVSTNNR